MVITATGWPHGWGGEFFRALSVCSLVKPTVIIAEAKTPDGGKLVLSEHDGTYAIRLNAQGLMDSSATESEQIMGKVGTALISDLGKPRILIGGLGLGFTLKSVLENVSAEASVHVAELLKPVVDWNRQHLDAVNGSLLNDPRVVVHVGDVFHLIRQGATKKYDVILLDIDNGPSAMVQDANSRLYTEPGLIRLAAALRTGGRAVIWSAGDDRAFQARLLRVGFRVEVVRAKRYPGSRKAGISLYVADKR